jgi:hypothetical protein
MGLSRRKFTHEFKLEAIGRLESGTSVSNPGARTIEAIEAFMRETPYLLLP